MQIPVRFKVIFMSFLAVFICYIDRVNISVAIIPKVILGYGLLLWSLFTVLTPAFAYNGFFAVLFIRVLLGLGEGVTFPSWHSLYARWIPFEERTRSIAITNSGISVGTVFGYLVTTIIISFYSWEWVFYYPNEHPKISSSELKLIIEKAPTSSLPKKISIFRLLSNLPFIAITIASIFILLILIPSIFSVISLIAGGFLADSLIKKKYQVIKVRKVLNSVGFFGSAFCLFLIPFQESHFYIISLLCMTNICSGMAAGGFGVNHADLGPEYTGSLVGIAGSLGMIRKC